LGKPQLDGKIHNTLRKAFLYFRKLLQAESPEHLKILTKSSSAHDPRSTPIATRWKKILATSLIILPPGPIPLQLTLSSIQLDITTRLKTTSCSHHTNTPHYPHTTTHSCKHKPPTQQANQNKPHTQNIPHPHPKPTITQQPQSYPPNPSRPHPATRTTKTPASQHKTQPNHPTPSGMVPTHMPLPRSKSTPRQRYIHHPHSYIHPIRHG